MSTLCKTYSDQAEAREAVERLLAAGTPRRSIRLLTGSPLHDVRAERVGTFAGSVDPDAQVGTFAGRPRRRRQGTVATHRMLRRLLRAVTLDGEPADRLVDELHVGHGLVLADQPPPASGLPRREM